MNPSEKALKVERTGLFFTCCYCRSELNESQIFDFRGSVGCENCIRDYYRDRPSKEIENQVRARRASAASWLGRNRKALERAAKNPPKKGNRGPMSSLPTIESRNVLI